MGSPVVPWPGGQKVQLLPMSDTEGRGGGGAAGGAGLGLP